MKPATFLVLLALLGLAQAEIKLQSVERKINLNSQFARITESIKVKNTGSKAVDRLTLCQAVEDSAVVAFQKVTQTVSAKAKLKFKPVSPSDAPANAQCVEATLKQPIAAGDVATIDTVAVLADAQVPYPAEITQQDTQLVLFNNNVYVTSPYSVSTQTTEVILPSSTVKSYSEDVKPVSQTDNKIKYGKYDLVKPWSSSPLRVHYENTKPFKKVLSLTREIEVSHWGNIYVEEQYELKNAGATHKGAFSRLRYAHTYNGKANSFQDLKARLPASAHSLYYVDIIGNISTSAVRKTATETVLDFMARYPLMGGWKVDFKIGYSVPLSGFLGVLKGGKRRLTFDFSTPLEGVYTEDMTVKVVLPEGATDIKTSVPHEVSESRDVKYTYLDVTGRPVVVLHKKHLVPEHQCKFTVDYSFAATGILREPMLLITAFFALFAIAIVYNRLEFTIARDDKWQAGQDAEKVATAMQAVNSVMDEQDEVLESLQRLTQSLRSGEDADAAHKERGSMEASYTALENKAKALLGQVAALQPKLADKARELIDRARGIEQRMMKQLTDKSDLLKKGNPASEVNKKLAPAQDGITQARSEYAAAVESLFAPY